MNRTEHLFCILGEEAAEVVQRSSKIMRFGVSEIQPNQLRDNSERLLGEIADLLAVKEMLEEEGALKKVDLRPLMDLKKKKVEKFLEYSRKQGTLQDEDK